MLVLNAAIICYWMSDWSEIKNLFRHMLVCWNAPCRNPLQYNNIGGKRNQWLTLLKIETNFYKFLQETNLTKKLFP